MQNEESQLVVGGQIGFDGIKGIVDVVFELYSCYVQTYFRIAVLHHAQADNGYRKQAQYDFLDVFPHGIKVPKIVLERIFLIFD